MSSIKQLETPSEKGDKSPISVTGPEGVNVSIDIAKHIRSHNILPSGPENQLNAIESLANEVAGDNINTSNLPQKVDKVVSEDIIKSFPYDSKQISNSSSSSSDTPEDLNLKWDDELDDSDECLNNGPELKHSVLDVHDIEVSEDGELKDTDDNKTSEPINDMESKEILETESLEDLGNRNEDIIPLLETNEADPTHNNTLEPKIGDLKDVHDRRINELMNNLESAPKGVLERENLDDLADRNKDIFPLLETNKADPAEISTLQSKIEDKENPNDIKISELINDIEIGPKEVLEKETLDDLVDRNEDDDIHPLLEINEADPAEINTLESRIGDLKDANDTKISELMNEMKSEPKEVSVKECLDDLVDKNGDEDILPLIEANESDPGEINTFDSKKVNLKDADTSKISELMNDMESEPKEDLVKKSLDDLADRNEDEDILLEANESDLGEINISESKMGNMKDADDSIITELMSDVESESKEVLVKENLDDLVDKNEDIHRNKPNAVEINTLESKVDVIQKNLEILTADAKIQNMEEASKDDELMETENIYDDDRDVVKNKLEGEDVVNGTITELDEEDVANKTTAELDDTDPDMSVDISIDINKVHRLNKPDVMIEIPTQELIEFEDTSQSFSEDNDGIVNSTCEEFDKNDDIINKDDLDCMTHDKVETNVSKYVEEVNSEKDNLEIEAVENRTDIIDMKLSNMNNLIAQKSSDSSDKPEFADDPQPSTSGLQTSTVTPYASDEDADVSDSLGLLAETSRVVDDDEQDEEDDGDDEEDFDQDYEMSVEHSEDSNTQQPEMEPKDQTGNDNTQESAADETIKVTEIVDRENYDGKLIKEDTEGELTFRITHVLTESVKEQEDVVLDKDEDMEVVQTEDGKSLEMAVDLENVTEAKEDSITHPQKEGVKEKPAAVTDYQEIANDAQTGSMDIETVKLSSDTSDNETDGEKKTKAAGNSAGTVSDNPQSESTATSKQPPIKKKKLEMAKPKNFFNIVDLGGSSSEDDIVEVPKTTEDSEAKTTEADTVTTVNIPSDIEVMSSGENISEILVKENEMVINVASKPKTPHKPISLNTSEVTIKTTTNASESTLVIPETTIANNGSGINEKSKPKFSLEVFNLDSDDEDVSTKKESPPGSPVGDVSRSPAVGPPTVGPLESGRCVNDLCPNGGTGALRPATAHECHYYDATRRRRAAICRDCAYAIANRTRNLIEGVKSFKPLMSLEMEKFSHDLVEISDSDSDDENDVQEEKKETIGEAGAKMLEEQLADVINKTWRKYNMSARLKEAQAALDLELLQYDKDSQEINDLLNEAQKATDKLRKDFYATFEVEKKEVNAIVIYDTPLLQNWTIEDVDSTTNTEIETEIEVGQKRRLSTNSDIPNKKAAIPMGYTPLDVDGQAQDQNAGLPTPDSPKTEDDSVDVSVVRLSAEAAPAGLPPPGEMRRPPLRPGTMVYAMQNAFGCWVPARIIEVHPKGNSPVSMQFTMCRVRFENKQKQVKMMPTRFLAYWDPPDVRMTIGTRVIASCKYSVKAGKRESFYSGIIAEMPNPVNNYRYLVFFDDGYAQYSQHATARAVCGSAAGGAWRDVHAPSRAFVRDYLRAYPERPMVRLRARQKLKVEWGGRWWPSEVLQVDASLAEVQFENGRREWIYRGSTRLAPLYLELQAAERHRARALPRGRATANKNASTLDMPYVEYTRSDEIGANKMTEAQQQEEIRRQRAVARKSTVTAVVPLPLPPAEPDNIISRVVYYTPKNAVRPHKMTPHICGPKCKRTDVLTLKELRTYNPLTKPLLSGWERQLTRARGTRCVVYRAPCGRRVRDAGELHRYLRAVRSDFPVDLFDFNPHTHCLAEFVLNKCHVSKKDLSHGKENVPVPCVNYYDDSLPEFCSYNTERTPTAGVPLNLDPEFLCGCDCTDDCVDKTKCACWKLTLEGARTIGLDVPKVGYVYKRLPEPLPSGIYECNSRCKCSATCLNRVAQHPLQLKLQVFKTQNRGWGIRALNDVPKGAFLCVYAGNLLTDATANLDGLNEGDEYLAELDYIEVVEQMKEGFEADIPEADKELDKEGAQKETNSSEEEDSSSSEEECKSSKTEKEDDDFKPAYGSIGYGLTEFNKRLRKRGKGKAGTKDKEKEKSEEGEKSEKDAEDECITISDDEEVRQPSTLTAQPGMGGKEYVPKYRSVRSYFGKDEACYIMDAKVQGNIGRYLNHSCSPNVFVQNVFVDTHDPRFPWVAFFALSHIKAGTELTWNYNYDIGSVPDKVLYCYCNAPNCRGRLL